MNILVATQEHQEDLSRGTSVSVKLSNGDIVSRIVWDVSEDSVVVCSERQYPFLLTGRMDFGIPIGFKWKYVVNGHSQSE